MKRSWYYWMYKNVLKDGWGSLVPDFHQMELLTKKQFDDELAGQTLHKLNKKELKKLKRLAEIKN